MGDSRSLSVKWTMRLIQPQDPYVIVPSSMSSCCHSHDWWPIILKCRVECQLTFILFIKKKKNPLSTFKHWFAVKAAKSSDGNQQYNSYFDRLQTCKHYVHTHACAQFPWNGYHYAHMHQHINSEKCTRDWLVGLCFLDTKFSPPTTL